jgi:hypothetical protein
MKKILKKVLFVVLLLILLIGCFLFIGKPKQAENITWGVSFSQKYSEELGLDWKENYLAVIDDLKVKNMRLIAYWDLIEKEKDTYDFQDLDWQIEQAKERDIKIILAIGKKVPRWPEYHKPLWVQEEKIENENQELLVYLEKIINRYKDNENILVWQVENEPFFPFGKSHYADKETLKQEIELVKSLDNKRPIIVTESGELPFWFKSAKYGDMVGYSLYEKVWFHEMSIYLTYPMPSVFYNRKAWLVDKLFHKETICIELQAEPWGPGLTYTLSLEEQNKTMNTERFKKIIEFSKNTGEDTFYLWGSEWWYWMKEKHNDSQMWEEAKKVFASK